MRAEMYGQSSTAIAPAHAITIAALLITMPANSSYLPSSLGTEKITVAKKPATAAAPARPSQPAARRNFA